MLSRNATLLFLSFSFSSRIDASGMLRGLSTHKRACVHAQAHLSRKRVRVPCLFIRPCVIMRCHACVGENSRRNISFGASCSFNQWHLWASRCTSSIRLTTYMCICVRISRFNLYCAKKKCNPERKGSPKIRALILSIIIYRLWNFVTRFLFFSFAFSAIVSCDKLRLCFESVYIYIWGCNFRIINHRNMIRLIWFVLLKLINTDSIYYNKFHFIIYHEYSILNMYLYVRSTLISWCRYINDQVKFSMIINLISINCEVNLLLIN